jgi:hypothetical protein
MGDVESFLPRATRNVIELLTIQSALPQGRMKLEVGTHRLELESTLCGHSHRISARQASPRIQLL